MYLFKLTRPALAAIFLLILFLPGCVKRSTLHTTQDELAQARRANEELSAQMASELARRDEREARLRDQITTLQREMDRLIEDLGTARRELLVAQEDLSAAQLEASRLANLLSAQGAEAQRLRGRLDQLSSIEQEIRERNRIYEDILGRFRSLIDAGRLSVSIVRGRVVINLPQDILFGSGSATLGQDGRQTVQEVATVLSGIEDRRFQVEGHTDNVPIATAQFPSNWELSASRALSVVKILVERGVPPENVSGAGYGEYHPVATNATPDGRRLNRRIEIVMLPNLDVIADTGVGE
jgi:chemotaxis protein MotB